MLFCTKCGSELSEDSLFCSKCGTEINAVQKAVQSSQKKNETPITPISPQEQRAKDIKQIKSDAKPILGCFGLIIVFFILLGACGAFNSPEPKRLEDYTNKEMKDFLKWKIKEDQKKQDNEPFFK